MRERLTPTVIHAGQEWHVEGEIGFGGFARVFAARSEAGQTAVVKLIPKNPGAEREILFEDLRGAPNVVPIIGTGEWDGHWVLVMPRAEMSLRDYMGQLDSALSVDTAIEVLTDILESLSGIRDNIVHRDIKPENILHLNGSWCLADFGIARYAEATTAADTFKYAKTYAYASPEQWRDDRAKGATDVYALGVVAYEMLAGQLPFPGPTGPDFRNQHLRESAPPIPGIFPWLQSMVDQCLIKQPDARPTPETLLAQLRANMREVSPGRLQLQKANAVVVRQRSEAERRRSVDQEEAERRKELDEIGRRSLNGILAMLHQQIVDLAPLANFQESQWGWSLNEAILLPDPVVTTEQILRMGSPFEVIIHTGIGISSPRGLSGYLGRSHSLWYCDARETGVFRWYETAFYDLSTSERNGVLPFSLPPGGQEAGSMLLGYENPVYGKPVQLARPFMPIDQGEEQGFIDRWLYWFGLAAQGGLRRPDEMPEEDGSGSWRVR